MLAVPPRYPCNPLSGETPVEYSESSPGQTELGRLLVEHNNLLGAVESTYRVDGVRTHIEYPDGAVFEIARNQAGAPEAMFEGAAGVGARIGRWNYDALNRIASFDWGQNPDPGRSSLTLGYDAISRLSSLANDLPAAATPGDVTIGLTAYNPAGQIVTRTRNDAAYVFDDSEEGTTGYTDNGLNQYSALTGVGAAALAYDERGNLTSYNPSGTANDRAYAYDARNLMTSATLAGGSATTLSYDPLGRLFFVNAAGTANDRRYLWDGDAIIAELNPTTGAIRRRFVHAPGSLGAPIAQYEGASVSAASRRYLQTDERGSVISAVDSDDGTQSSTNTYDPYGRPGSGNSGQFQYAGQLWLPETGTYYMRARMYEPVLGRFLQTDPIGYMGGMNLCAYAGNDPINFWDPLGLQDGQVIVVTGSRFVKIEPPPPMKAFPWSGFPSAPPGGEGSPGAAGADKQGEDKSGEDDPCGGRLTTNPTAGTDLATPAPGTGQGAPDFGDRGGGHYGLDIANKAGAAVFAAGAGQVVRAEFPADPHGFGGQVVLSHGGGVFSQYAHLGAVFVEVGGNRVSAGDIIGRTAKPGDSSGGAGNLGGGMSPHLHFEVRIGSALAPSQGGNPIDPKLCIPGG